jgi:hypothetical protein
MRRTGIHQYELFIAVANSFHIAAAFFCITNTTTTLTILTVAACLLFALPAISRFQLPSTTSALFARNLYTRVIPDTSAPTIKVGCTQSKCTYRPTPRPIASNTTNNLLRHYEQCHPQISRSSRQSHCSQASLPSSQASNSTTFFAPRSVDQLKLLP